MHTRNWMLIVAMAAVLALPSLGQAQTKADKTMASRVAAQIKNSGQLSNYRVGVKFESGTAWLLGTVTDAEQAAAAEELAGLVKGVDRVVNKLEIASAEEEPVVKIETPEASQQEEGSADLLLELAKSEIEAAEPVAENAAYEPPALPTPQAGVRPAPARRTAMAGRRGMPTPFARTGRPPVQPASHRNVQPAGYGGAPGYGGPGYGPQGMPAGGAGGVQGVQYENPNLPGYAWPSYAAHPNYSAVTYPKQYSPTAWPYIGPFYPYPQVPLGWRKVALEWDDGWWFLDFSHHQRH